MSGGAGSYSELTQEALEERMLWVKLDTDMMRDMKIRRLQAFARSIDMDALTVKRYALVGMYVATILHMGENDTHIYDLSDDFGWDVFADDMRMPEEDAREFVAAALEVGLFDNGLYEESKKLASNRLLRELEVAAGQKAASRSRTAAAREAKAAKKASSL